MSKTEEATAEAFDEASRHVNRPRARRWTYRPSASRHSAMASSLQSIRSECGGYFAMLAFLTAYLLSVMERGQMIQVGLNLAGAAVAASYLYKKGALPTVVSNVAWAAITIAGLVVG